MKQPNRKARDDVMGQTSGYWMCPARGVLCRVRILSQPDEQILHFEYLDGGAFVSSSMNFKKRGCKILNNAGGCRVRVRVSFEHIIEIKRNLDLHHRRFH